MDSADELTFRIIFSGDGAGRLRDKVKEKLKEFMGDYTDDTLVEYVIVLLKNGRRKEEAKNELNVFLGDDSDSFVSWLWDHLRSNLNLYAQPKDEVAKQKNEDCETEGVVVKSKKRVSKDWRGVMRDPDEPPPLRSAVIANIHQDDENTLQPAVQRKRGRSGERDDRSQVKREAVSIGGGASRRLLQFAVRDAVGTSRSTTTTGLTLTSSEQPSLKRLRSVVSTPNNNNNINNNNNNDVDDEVEEEDSQIVGQRRRPKMRSVAARVPKAMAVAMKAVADAAKDVVVKVKPPSGNVFDRLGRSTDADHQLMEYRDEEDAQATTVPTYYHNNLEEEEGYANMDLRGGKMGISQIRSDSVMLGYSAAAAAYNKLPQKDENSSHNNNNMVNVNSGKPSQSLYQKKPRAVSEIENHKAVHETAANSVIVSNGNGAPVIHAQRDIQKTLASTGGGRPTEDVDSRTIFVSNVHFGATKDSLSRHFNKFGDVLKVVIVTDPATGQPKGSAYVEFLKKEAAENALSLDATSFMSRILKVVRKNQEGTGTSTTAVTSSWPRAGVRGPPIRFGRSGVYRPPRLPLKSGARSFQWKRDSIPSPTTTTTTTTAAARSLTYVRPEAAPKTAHNV